jgi:hypothetical protein
VCRLLAGPSPHGEGPTAFCERDVVRGWLTGAVVDESVGFTWFGTRAVQAVSQVAEGGVRAGKHLTPRATAGSLCSRCGLFLDRRW